MHRYDLTHNLHLYELFKENPSLLEAWKKTLKCPVEELLDGEDIHEMENCIAEITDDPIDILLSRRESYDSLNYHELYFESLEFNQGLLGPLLNGKHLLACIKNDQGNVIAESLFSVCFSKNKPVLLQWDTYPLNRASDQQKRALKALAEKKANDLQCKTFMASYSTMDLYHSFESPNYETSIQKNNGKVCLIRRSQDFTLPY